MTGTAQAKQPQVKIIPISGMQLVNRENKGVLVVDQQNAVNQFNHYGFPRVDPSWYINIANRATNLHRSMVACNLFAKDPILFRPYLNTSWIWSEQGFSIVHVPARRINTTINANTDPDSPPSERSVIYKDMTDMGVRDEIRFTSDNSAVSHILIGSHDIDYAADIRQAGRGKNIKTTLLTVGDDFIATNLCNSADDVINVMIYAGSFAARALDKRRWWNNSEPLTTRQQKIEKWFSGNGVYPKYIEYQFKDMQMLFLHMLHDLELTPTKRKLSFAKLKFAIHDLWREEKIMAELKVSLQPSEFALPHSLEYHEYRFPTEQVKAMDKCLTEMINVFIQNQVLLFDFEGATATKLFHLNIDHPAVNAILETGFG